MQVFPDVLLARGKDIKIKKMKEVYPEVSVLSSLTAIQYQINT